MRKFLTLALLLACAGSASAQHRGFARGGCFGHGCNVAAFAFVQPVVVAPVVAQQVITQAVAPVVAQQQVFAQTPVFASAPVFAATPVVAFATPFVFAQHRVFFNAVHHHRNFNRGFNRGFNFNNNQRRGNALLNINVGRRR